MTGQNNIADLIDKSGYEAAAQKQQAVEAKLHAAEAALAEAERAVNAAWDDTCAGVASVTSGKAFDPMAGADAHAAAVTKARFAARVVGELERLNAEAMAECDHQWKESHRPVLNRGIETRIQAAADADKARAALKAAEELHQEGTRLIQSAHAHGVPRPFDGGYLMRPIDTEMNERAMWDMQ